VNAGLRAANARLRELLAAKDAQIEALTGQLEELRAQVADLAAQVGRNSENSSRPPSSDGLGKPAPKSLRNKTGRKPGRPKGQPGVTMELTDHPDHVIRHEPPGCRKCGTGLAGALQTGAERWQVTEIPPVKAEVTEHQVIEMECPCCGERTKADAPDGVTAPVQYGPRAAALGTCLRHGQFLSRDRACAALGEVFSCAPGPRARWPRRPAKIAGLISPAIIAITGALAGRTWRTSMRPGSGSPGSWPGSTWRRRGSSCWSPCIPSAESRPWTPPGCYPRSQASPATTPGSPTTATTASPGTLYAARTCSGTHRNG
jgi:transposase